MVTTPNPTPKAARSLYRALSSYVEESSLADASSDMGAIPYAAMVVPPSTTSPHPSFRGGVVSFGSSFRGSIRNSLRKKMSRSPAPSPRIGKPIAATAVVPSSPNLPTKSVPEDEELSLDSLERQYNPLVSFVVVYTMIFFNGCCFTAVVPSVPFYLQELGAPPSFLGEWMPRQ
jgi:hypothetical protein